MGRESESLTTQAARGVIWVLVGKSAGRLLTVIVLVMLARLLNAEDFGVVALASVVTAFLVLIRDQGFAAALVQRRSLEAAHLATAFWTSVAIGLLLTLALWFAADAVSQWFHEPALAPVLRALSLTFLIGGIRTTPAALLTRELDFRSLTIIQLAGTATGGAVGVGLAIAGAGVWALVGQALADVVVETFIVVLRVRWRPSMLWSLSALRDLIGFSSNQLGVQVLNFIGRRGDDLLVGAVLGPVALGLYTVAYRVLRLVLEIAVEVISLVGLPTLARLQHDLPRLRRGVEVALGASAALCVPAFGFIAVCSSDVVVVVFGPKWSAAASVMSLLAIGGVVAPALTLYMQALAAAGQPGWSLAIAAVNGLTHFAAVAIGVQFGLEAVALAYIARSFVVLPVALVIARRQIGLGLERLRGYIAPILASLLMIGVVAAARWALDDALAPALRLAVLAATGSVTYSLVLRRLAPGDVRELTDLARRIVGGRRLGQAPSTVMDTLS